MDSDSAGATLLTVEEIRQLGDDGWFMRSRFLPLEVLQGVAQSAKGLEGYRAAGIGKGADHRVAPSIRGDEIVWLRPDAPSPGLTPLIEALESLRLQLNEHAYLGLEKSEIQVARYLAPGAGYQSHRDALRGNLARRVTALCYLNEGWEPAHGGQLRLHLSEGSVVDVPPTLGTLVVFLSDRIDHEVLPVFAPRHALTVWWGR